MVINSILDTDLYKFSVSYAYFKLYPYAEGTFTFTDRNKENWSKTNFVDRMREQIYSLSSLKLTLDEEKYCIENIPYIPACYWEWLRSFRFDPSKVVMFLDNDGIFHCTVTDSLYKVTLYEIVILAIYSELRSRYLWETGKISVINDSQVETIIRDKVHFANANNLSFSEFGTRRRFSYSVQDIICSVLAKEVNTCAGTSNVHFAMKYGMKPIGTFPHEWVMFHGAVFGYKRANYLCLEDWIDVYDGNLGTALIDTYTTESFLRTLTRKQAMLLSGFRQDSGDEFKVGNMIIQRLQEFGIDPKSKLIVFSNALTFKKYKEIHDYFNGRVKISAGIGGNLTNGVGIPEYIPANIVMKLSACRMSNKDPWESCIKISDDNGKHMGNNDEFERAKAELHLNI